MTISRRWPLPVRFTVALACDVRDFVLLIVDYHRIGRTHP